MKYLLVLCMILSMPLLCLQAQVVVTAVQPGKTDPAVKSIHGDHLALFDAKVKARNTLLLMIVGTGGSARDNLPFDSFAASMGYHVISLDYNNTVITTACSNSSDSACFNKFRQEIVFGEQVSELVQVDSSNSILHRFFELLVYLAKEYPQQNWQQYLQGNAIRWPKVIVAGHSQGAGHAAYLGKKFPVQRVLIFAGPQDYLVQFNKPAGWLSAKSITPANKYFAFLHYKDPFDFSKQLAGCRQLMQAQNTDTVLVTNTTDFARHHILVTNIETPNPHGSMLQVQFHEAWRYLLSPMAAVK